MTMPSNSHVVAVEKLCDGVVVTFDDGVSAAFSARLLRMVLLHAEAVWALAQGDARAPLPVKPLDPGLQLTGGLVGV